MIGNMFDWLVARADLFCEKNTDGWLVCFERKVLLAGG
jgi:hypothetical protein